LSHRGVELAHALTGGRLVELDEHVARLDLIPELTADLCHAGGHVRVDLRALIKEDLPPILSEGFLALAPG